MRYFVFVSLVMLHTAYAPCSNMSCESLGLDPASSGTFHDVCGSSLDCSGELHHGESLIFCETNNMRLCDLDEMIADETANTGCGYDRHLMWTSSECTSDRGGQSHWVAAGEFIDGGVPECASSEGVFRTRCCADSEVVSDLLGRRCEQTTAVPTIGSHPIDPATQHPYTDMPIDPTHAPTDQIQEPTPDCPTTNPTENPTEQVVLSTPPKIGAPGTEIDDDQATIEESADCITGIEDSGDVTISGSTVVIEQEIDIENDGVADLLEIIIEFKNSKIIRHLGRVSSSFLEVKTLGDKTLVKVTHDNGIKADTCTLFVYDCLGNELGKIHDVELEFEECDENVAVVKIKDPVTGFWEIKVYRK